MPGPSSLKATSPHIRRRRRLTAPTVAVAVAAVASLVAVSLGFGASAIAAEAPVGLGTSASYSVLGGSTVTNTGPTTLSGDLGVSPGTAITGFPPGVASGATHAGDAAAAQAQADVVTAYNDAAGRAPTASVAGDLVGRTLVGGVYTSSGPLALSGTLTLDAQGDPNTVFIFQVGSTLTTASASMVSLVNGAQACNIYWQVGSSATLGTGSSFKGTILALTSITVTTGTTVQGRALARNGAVTLDTDTFTNPGCAASPTPTATATPTSTTTATTTPTSTPEPDATIDAGAGDTPASDDSTAAGTPGGATELARSGGGTSVAVAGTLLLVFGGLLVAIARMARAD